MARAFKRLRLIDSGKIYHAAKPVLVRGELCPQQSPRCVSVLLISDESCSTSSELKEIFREELEKITDFLKTVLEQSLCKRPEPCAQIWCDGHKKHGRRAAGRIYHFPNRKSDPHTGTRLLYDWGILLRNRFFEKKYAPWYREGPPNIRENCHTMKTAA